jgi:hypothetical protein
MKLSKRPQVCSKDENRYGVKDHRRRPDFIEEIQHYDEI